MEIRNASGAKAIAVLVTSITITAAVLAAAFIDALAPASLTASNPLHCTDIVHPEVLMLEFIEDC